MKQPFGSDYANCYDALYAEKDYEAECDLIERVLRTYGEGKFGSILDLGCGTGNHALPLARRGFDVSGVDRSNFMLEQARSKAIAMGRPPPDHFHHGDIRNVELGQQFDAALLMFAVLGYQIDNADVIAALRSARRHLRPRGLLMFDVWYGPAVLFQRPSGRVKTIPTSTGSISRVSSSELDLSRHTCTVHYRVSTFVAERMASETEETHTVRYFFPRDLELFLEATAFTLVRLGAFPAFDCEPDETTWNVLVVARGV